MKRRKNANIAPAQNFLRGVNSGNMRPFIAEDGEAYIMVHKGGDRNDINNFSQQPVNNAVLRYDEWRQLDDAVIKIGEQRLIGFDDLRSRGLVYTLGNAMGTTVLTWEELSDAMEAFIGIDPTARGKGDLPDYGINHIPIPVIFSDYIISDRILQESRTRGNPVSTTSAERAARKVNEKLEDMLFGASASMTYGGGSIHSYVSHPDVNTLAFASAGEYWDDAAKTPAQIVQDVKDMKALSVNAFKYGPWMVYVPTDYDLVLDDDYNVSGTSLMTTRERIMKIEGILGVRVVDRLPADTVAMVQMTSDVVDLVDGMAIQNIQWDSEGGMIHHYKVMTIQITRVKSDYNSNSGIVILS